MKDLFYRYFLLCTVSVLSALFSVSCSSSTDDKEDGADYVTVSPQSDLFLEADAATVTLEIESSGPWSVSGMPAWLEVEPETGESGDNLVVTVSENETVDGRYAVLTVTCGTATATINVTQYGNIETDYVNMHFDNPSVSYTYSETSGELSVTYDGVSKPDVSVGSAIVLPADQGYDIRVVESLASTGNTLNISTSQGNMCNLFRNISFVLSTNPYATRSVAGERVFTPVSYGYRDENGAYHEYWKRDTRSSFVSEEEFWTFTNNFNGKSIIETAAGKLYWETCEFNAGLNAAFQFEFGEKDGGRARSIGDLNSFSYLLVGNMGMDMLLHYYCEKSYSKEGDEIVKEDVIKPKDVVFMVGEIPVLVTVCTDLGASYSVEAKGAVDASTGIRYSNEMYAGISWRKGRGVELISPEANPFFDIYPPTLKAEASLEARASFYPKVRVKLYKFLGPWVELHPYLSDKIEAGMRASTDGKNYVGWKATLSSGLDCRFGLDLNFAIFDEELWSSDMYNLIKADFFQAPRRITRLLPEEEGEEVAAGQVVEAEFLVEAYCTLTKSYYPCPWALVSFEAESGKLENLMAVADMNGKVKVKWTPVTNESNPAGVATRAGATVERKLSAILIDNKGHVIDEATFMIKAENKNTCNNENHVHAVDLGLSVKWACCNVGATKPEEAGGYYAWGETSEKDEYTDDTYIWWTTEGVKWYLSGKITKYCNNDSETHNDIGCYDGRGVLEAGDDVARVVMGGNWRMPTEKEITELTYNCKREYTSVNGVPGFVLTGPNGNSIFLPLSGYKYEGDLCYKNEVGCFWGSTVRASCDRADNLYCSKGVVTGRYNMRYYGYNVRAVCE